MIILDKQELSQYLKVSMGTVKYLLYENKIPKIRIGREYRFIKSEIDGWLHHNKQQPKRFSFREL